MNEELRIQYRVLTNSPFTIDHSRIMNEELSIKNQMLTN
jgi:hypothetical protein